MGEPRRAGAIGPEERKDRICDMYDSGRSLAEIMEACGCKRSYVYKVLAQRDRHGFVKPAALERRERERRAIVLYADGCEASDIAELLGMTAGEVSLAWARRGRIDPGGRYDAPASLAAERMRMLEASGVTVGEMERYSGVSAGRLLEIRSSGFGERCTRYEFSAIMAVPLGPDTEAVTVDSEIVAAQLRVLEGMGLTQEEIARAGGVEASRLRRAIDSGKVPYGIFRAIRDGAVRRAPARLRFDMRRPA